MKQSKRIWLSFFLMLIGFLIVGGTNYYAYKNLKGTSTQNVPTTSNDQMGTPPSGSSMGSGIPPTGGSNMPMGSSMGQMPSNNTSIQTTETETLTIWYEVVIGAGTLIFTIGLLYFLLSKFGKSPIFISGDKTTIYLLLAIILTALFTYGNIYFTNNYILNRKSISSSSATNTITTNTTAEATGVQTINGEKLELTDKYTSSKADENAILVTNGGTATVNNATLTKTGDTTSTENSEFYGINAGILVQKNSTATITSSTITTSSKGSNAVFATGENAIINISDTVINTKSDSSRGLDATYGGIIKATNVTITTKGQSCATLATDRGEGTVSATDSKLETNGKGSPIIYSTGDISITNTTGTANNAQMVVIEGKNSATITDSKLTATAIGNRNDVDNAGVMIYQSMSGDAGEGTGTFTSSNSSLQILSSSSVYKTAPMFFITNTNAKINLTKTSLTYGSNILISIKGTSEWGTSGSNGGALEFNATSETLTGNIELDKLSTLEFNLTSSTYDGTINSDNTAKNINVKLDKDSLWNVTGDSHINELTDEDATYSNIKSNGHIIYYDGEEDISLSDGGKLVSNN